MIPVLIAAIGDRRRARKANAASDELAEWPAELVRIATPSGTIGGETPIWDRLLWEAHAITGGTPELFATVDGKMSADTRAWRRHRKPPTSGGAEDSLGEDKS